jgi:uncharacterized damage-inducible protein DinB
VSSVATLFLNEGIMNIQEAQALVEYNYWARDHVLAAVDALTDEQYASVVTSSFASIRDTLVHVLSAESVWLSRWKGDANPGVVSGAGLATCAALREVWQEQEMKTRAYFDSVTEESLAGVIEYRAFNGQPFATPLFQMLQHVVNHGSYHRGQVTTLLRQLGAAPPQSLDLIVFYRDRA